MCGKNSVPLWVLGNIVLSVAIVLVNKVVYVRTKFPNITLTFIHFVVTFFGIHLCESLNVFQAKRLPVLQVLPLAISFCGFVVFTNLSLGYNTVGTYQILKTLTMPTIMLIQTFMYGRTFSWKIKSTLKFTASILCNKRRNTIVLSPIFSSVILWVPISFGVIINSTYDIKFNLLGTVFALVGVIVTSFYQVILPVGYLSLSSNTAKIFKLDICILTPLILLFSNFVVVFGAIPYILATALSKHWVGEKQKEFQVNSMQLLYYQAPLSAMLLLFCVPLVEPPWALDGFFYRSWSITDMMLVLLSGVIAFLVNVSIYWIIGNTSAVTYNVVGQLKFCLTLLGGYLLFMEPVLPIQFLGILITIFGVSLYAFFKHQDQKSLPFTTQK